MPKALIDCDAFFASCEQAKNPSLAGKSLIIAGAPGTRSVVSSASYPAKRQGVKAGMSPSEAARICPEAIFLSGDFSYYASVHRLMGSKLEALGFAVESSSIDEFYVESTSSYEATVSELRKFAEWVEASIGISVSIGVAPTKILAKLASEIVKPKGLTVLRPDELPCCLDKFGVERLLGIGKATVYFLKSKGILTLGQLRASPEIVLKQLGLSQDSILRLLSGLDEDLIQLGEIPPKSISCRMTLPFDVSDKDTMLHCIHFLSDHVSSRMRKEGMCAKTITITIRYDDFETAQKSKTLCNNIVTGYEVAEFAMPLFESHWDRSRNVRLIGLGLSSLSMYEGSLRQVSLLPEELRKYNLTNALDRIRSRHGNKVISLASTSCIFGRHPRENM